jgi:hypothetical protein
MSVTQLEKLFVDKKFDKMFPILEDLKLQKQDNLSALKTLELGCLYSISTNKIQDFQSYYKQLENYYSVESSERMYQITGLYLLHLLSSNNLSAFHTKLESIKDLDNVYIKHVVQIEQSLMEGLIIN